MPPGAEVQSSLPQPELDNTRIEQVGRLLATGRACRKSARTIAADGLACGVICLPVVNCTRLTTCAFAAQV